MKAFRNVLFLALIFVITFTSSVKSQTFQTEFSVSTDFGYLFCLDEPVSGSFTYHITWHKSPKTGFIDRVHWNINDGTFIGLESGNRYRVHDTGQDNLGLNWGFFAAVSGVPEDLIPSDLPIEGSIVNMNFKFTSKGIAYKGEMLLQLHLNAKGEPTAEVMKYTLCF